MIEPMEKVLLACRTCDRKRLLRRLRRMGLMHLLQTSRQSAGNPEALALQLATCRRALALAAEVPDPIPGITAAPDNVAQRLTALETELAGVVHDAAQLQAQIKRQALFGDLCADDVTSLASKGIALSFWRVSGQTKLTDETMLAIPEGDDTPDSWILVTTEIAPTPPAKGAVLLTFPKESASNLRATLQSLMAREIHLRHEKRQLAYHLPALEKRVGSLTDTIRWQQALADAYCDRDVFVISGWLPSRQKQNLVTHLREPSLQVGGQSRPPETLERPPTLWTPPRFARPVNALFRILGTTPGYRESDVSIGFMVALPVFCALLIADGGYGLLLLLAAILGYRFARKTTGKELSQLGMVIGAASTIWGVLIASFFGFDPEALSGQPDGLGALRAVGHVLSSLRLFDGSLSDTPVVNRMMALAFTLGAVHMTIARLWRGWRCLPSTEAISHVGWVAMVWGMLLLTHMLVLDAPQQACMVPLLTVGACAIAVFSGADKPLPGRILPGIAQLPLGALGVLSDTISYIRLMAVGLASTILGATFNLLAADISQVSVVLAGVVFVLGHSLNIALALVALFAHGVRLNMLEFSTHLGMNWTGYRFTPFCFAGKKE
jgi:V/A-type H+/Na+-transporting ATPase subunit I